ncbi:xanthan lyase [uncultured Bacteroides sp.]|uniref:golvesin C-terminal-like domain-containing protein n=1 Tax=uncultured Bacteroides sp. TaxID=162156 RepID=UPI00260438B8|nr:xanthan lyase [uncultured Bacteroides sp.]
MKRIHLLYTCLLFFSMPMSSQSLENNVEQRLNDYFNQYKTTNANFGTCKLEHVDIDHDNKTIKIYANSTFGYQPFTEENTQAIYRTIKQILPGPVNYYSITLYTDDRPIEELIPNAFRGKGKEKDKSRLYGKIDYKGAPWVLNVSKPYEISKGLQNRHIALWQSHGKFFKIERQEWLWQRPRLFGTTEDLFTQSIVIPYLIPMLENAGAVVYTPRERDWQKNEVVVDNDEFLSKGQYIEVNYKKKYRWNVTRQPGFAYKYTQYRDTQNPFTDGSARFIPTLSKPEKAFAEWIPNIPATGKYAVYVSYQSLPESITDAKYLVFHKGGVTEFKVNQQIGGGTWVYLGTFEFDKGINDYGMVVLSNESSQNGVVCADAVRFGGGMGTINRDGQLSGMPRYLEGARYWGQWAGMPYSVYSKSNGANDYNDDINARSQMINYLSGGSVYNPIQTGLKVPFEMSLAVHSDAGFKEDNNLVGSLSIYTTNFNEGKLNSGISRYASRDLADMVLTGLKRDISSRMGVDWARRSMWNRNYSETRLPAVPSIILETLSHQNFADMVLGYNPEFKFTVGRSVYKSILKYLANMHSFDYTVQPLPVNHFSIKEGTKKNTFVLSWNPAKDPLEPTANPQGYIVYTRIGYGGFDNGTYTRTPNYTIEIEPGLVYSFKVTAVNRGGESFPSEILAAYKAKKEKKTALIVNGFHRTSGPGYINTETEQGFDIQYDPGLPYISTTQFCGYQQNFDRERIGIESVDGLGFSGQELEGKEIAGNTFDYPFIHGKAIQRSGDYSFVSCSLETIESGSVQLNGYDVVDLIYGAEQKQMSPTVEQAFTDYCNNGGNLMVSGAFIGNRLGSTSFTRNVLKFIDGGNIPKGPNGEIYGTNINFNIPRMANETTYTVSTPACIQPVGGSFSSFVYTQNNLSAGIAYKGNYRLFVLGFPFESILDTEKQTHIMKSALYFFNSRK